MDDAGTALAGVAADMGSCKAEVVADEIDEQRPAFHVAGNLLAVYRHRNGGHAVFSLFWAL